jgi:hypothetical protein
MIEIMGPEHPRWGEFRRLLRERLRFVGRGLMSCPGISDKPLTYEILKDYFPTVNVPATFEFFETMGGYCDCEVLLNVK